MHRPVHAGNDLRDLAALIEIRLQGRPVIDGPIFRLLLRRAERQDGLRKGLIPMDFLRERNGVGLAGHAFLVRHGSRPADPAARHPGGSQHQRQHDRRDPSSALFHSVPPPVRPEKSFLTLPVYQFPPILQDGKCTKNRPVAHRIETVPQVDLLYIPVSTAFSRAAGGFRYPAAAHSPRRAAEPSGRPARLRRPRKRASGCRCPSSPRRHSPC